ncbi:MAG TPA: CsbD family protein [Acidimicrobiales bacterium]|nr:CsbD family protein [Acidimicrobiales bacterium]
MGEKLDDMKGRAKEAAGDLTDNEDLEREGKVDQGKAEVKEHVGNAADKVGDKVNDLFNR